jgi:GxxExxY protein
MYEHSDITEKIIKAAHNVHNTLGYGFVEKVYHKAMVIELQSMELSAVAEKPIIVYYANQIVGEYFADIVVSDKVIVEIKAVQALAPAHEVQLVNYLKATNIDVGLLLNFGESLGVKRKIFQTARLFRRRLTQEDADI